MMLGAARCCGPLGAGTGTFWQDAGAAPPDGAAVVVVLVSEVLAVAAVVLELALLLLLPLLPQAATTNIMATARHALRTELKIARSRHCELLEPWKLKPVPVRVPPPPLEPIELLLLIPPREPARPGGTGGLSNVCVVVPLDVASSADFTTCKPGHQATNQPLPTVACTVLPSSSVSVTPVTSAPVRPSASE